MIASVLEFFRDNTQIVSAAALWVSAIALWAAFFYNLVKGRSNKHQSD